MSFLNSVITTIKPNLAAQSVTTDSPASAAAVIAEATALQFIAPPLEADGVATQTFADTHIPESLFIPEVADEIAEDTIIEPEEDDSSLYSMNSFTV